MQFANDSHSNGTVKGAGEKEYWKGKGHAMHSEIYTPMLLLTPSMAMTELVKISSEYELASCCMSSKDVTLYFHTFILHMICFE